MALIDVRQGTLSAVLVAEDTSPLSPTDAGVTAAYLAPLNAKSQFKATQSPIEIPLFTGDRTTNASTWGDIMAGGALPLDWDFLFSGRIATFFFGRGNYTRPGGGTTKLHRWTNSSGSTATPAYVQIENQFKQATAQYFRHRGVRLDTMAFKQNLKGAVTYQVTGMGVGDIQTTSLVPSPVAAVTNDGPFLIPNYYNGLCYVNGVLCNPKDFGLTLSNNLSRSEAAFLAGQAANINFGKMSGKGNLALMFATDGSLQESNLTFYNYAKNQTPIKIEWWIFDAPTAGAWTKYFRIRAWVNFFLDTETAGGAEERQTNMQYMIASSPSCVWPGEIIAAAPGPYTLPASAALGFKPDGGGTVTTVLGITGSQTAAAIAAALNADTGAGHFFEKMTADVVAGALRVVSNTTGAASSVQVDGAVANTAHTAIGFNTVSQVGYAATSLIADELNGLTSTY
jgi:hypothetical protein